MEWQPIETAPRDERIDLWSGGERVPDCFWMDGYKWRDDDLPKDCFVYMDGDLCYDVYQPTHWMPLPQPPEQP